MGGLGCVLPSCSGLASLILWVLHSDVMCAFLCVPVMLCVFEVLACAWLRSGWAGLCAAVMLGVGKFA
jgi:hypothetical protein